MKSRKGRTQINLAEEWVQAARVCSVHHLSVRNKALMSGNTAHAFHVSKKVTTGPTGSMRLNTCGQTAQAEGPIEE